MGRRRQDPGLDDLFELLTVAPAWLGPLLALLAFVLFRYVLPRLFAPPPEGMDLGVIMRPMLSMFSWLIPLAILGLWAIAEVLKLADRRRLDRQTGIGTIRDLSWREFERLVCEAYRRKGYLAQVVGSGAGDGGVDIELIGHRETVLVQCKQWKAYRVGVKPVRELLGVVVSRRAARGILVTSGRFTRDAARFAEQNPQIELVDGPRLAQLVASVQTGHGASESSTRHADAIAGRVAEPPSCPNCGATMVLRTARRGPRAGSQFWGCAHYPGCRGTLPALPGAHSAGRH